MVDVSQCSSALILDTFQEKSSRFLDWRLAERVTEDTYNKIKHDAGVSAEIFGIPIGANYSDFQSNIKKVASNHDESLTEQEAVNILWTGLGSNSSDAYKHCIDQVTNSPGIHLTVVRATDTDVTISIKWEPMGGGGKVQLQWSGELAKNPALPKSTVPGTQTIVINRPPKEQQLAVNVVGHGAADSIVITPLPLPHPTPGPGSTEFHLQKNDRLQWIRYKQSIDWRTSRLVEGSYNFVFSLRLHPDPKGAQFRVGYALSINDKVISPDGAWVDLQFGDHPDVINFGSNVDLPDGESTIKLSITGVYNADPTYGNFTNPDAGAVSADPMIEMSLQKT